MPTPTDLVTSLPADFEVFGQAVDSTMADLKGGTSGQILSKNSNTDMDFVWITNDQGDITAVNAGTGLSGGGTSGSVTLSIDTSTTVDLTTAQTLTNKTLTSPALTTPTISTLTTNGDLLYGTGSGAIARRAIGTTGQVLTVSGGVPTWAAPVGGGKVLQVVQATTSTDTAIASTTYTDTTLSASITPSATSSKILIFVNQFYEATRNDNANAGVGIRLMRGATAVFTPSPGAYQFAYAQAVGATKIVTNGVGAITYLDSPATTSSITYKTQGAQFTNAGSANITFQQGNAISQITLMEIGA